MRTGAIPRWLPALAALALTIAMPAAQGVPAARAAFPVSNGTIAFMSTLDGNPEIYTVNPDGSGLARLTHSDAGDIAPAWSPDGTRIAFVCFIGPETEGGFRTVGPSDICVMDADGRGSARLTNDPVSDGEPTWSPDGSRIAFRRAADIYTMQPDGTDVTRLTTDVFAYEPAWSPDGTTIAFTSRRDLGADGMANPEIYVMDADGTGAVNLTKDLATEDGHPAWSPDGTRIAYDSYPSAGGAVAVWLMDPDGSDKVRLPPAPGSDSEPAWSPDGAKIAFTRVGDPPYYTDIFVRNADGTGAVALTKLPGFDGSPDWQPVPSPTPTTARSWAATISGAGLSGRASLTVPTRGWASAIYWLYRLKAGVAVSARVVAGATCDATAATTIKRLPGYTTTSGGTWRQRWVFDGAGLVRLRAAIRRGTALWFDVSAGGSRVCTRLVPAAASRADMITGNGRRESVAFEFHVVLTPSGKVVGRFDSNLMSNIGVLIRGDVDCGWVTGNIGVLGGLMDGADPDSIDSYFTVMVSDGPDGIIIGTGRPDCGTTGFGAPGSLPISSGEIVVIDL